MYIDEKFILCYTYDAWGNHTVSGSNVALGNRNPFRYRSYFYDPETRLYFLKTRYYDPEIGRFISPDSIDYADPMLLDGLNLYAYCNNNPVMNVDPTGTSLIGFIVWGAINIVKNITTKKPQPQKTENTSFNEFGNDFGSEWDLDLGMGLQNPFEQIRDGFEHFCNDIGNLICNTGLFIWNDVLKPLSENEFINDALVVGGTATFGASKITQLSEYLPGINIVSEVITVFGFLLWFRSKFD